MTKLKAFQLLVKNLKKSNFKVSQDKFEKHTAHFKGKGIPVMGSFSASGTRPYLNGYLMADHLKCFNKIQQSPLRISIGEDYEVILAELKKLGTPLGFKVSNNFLYHDKNPFKYDRTGLD